MAWIRLTIDTGAEHVADLTDLLERFEAVAVSYAPRSGEAIFAGTGAATPLWRRTAVSTLVDAAVDMDILLACIRNRIGAENIHHHAIEPLAEQDWSTVHHQAHGRMWFGSRLQICPSWLEPEHPVEHTLILDPGLAFGTGGHETTALCLEWLAGQDLAHRRVIDYGCGSGILALAAARLGAVRVFAVDNDPLALYATRDNAARNGLEPLLAIQDPDQADLPVVELLLANILLQPLLELAPRFADLVIPGGSIVLSGLLSTQVPDCLAIYARWFTMDTPVFRNEWAMMHGRRLDGRGP